MPTPERNHNHNHERLDLRRDLHRPSLPPPPELYSPKKPKSKLLYFFLKAVIMIALGSCFFFIVGGSAILLLLFKLGPASTASRRRRFREHFPGSDAEFSREDLCELPRIKLSCDPPESADECVVCLSNLADGDWCRILPDCGHKFHADCIDNWLVKASVCPICRRGVRLDRDSIEAGIRRQKTKQLWIDEVSI